MFDDDHRRIRILPDLLDDLNGLFAGGRIKVCQRLIKKEQLYIIYHDTGHGYTLLLSAGELSRGMIQMLCDIYPAGCFLHPFLHLFLGDTVIFQGKGDILCHRQTDKLPVQILQHGSHRLGNIKNTLFRIFLSIDQKASGLGTPVGKGDQTIDAVGQSGLPAAGGTGDQDLLSGMDLQVDIVERRLRLGPVLKAEVLKFNKGFSLFVHSYLCVQQLIDRCIDASLSLGRCPTSSV